MTKQGKIRLTGTILVLFALCATGAIILLIKGMIPETYIAKENAEYVAVGIFFLVVFAVSLPWDFLVKEEKPSRLPAKDNHPIWEKRKDNPTKYGTIRPLHEEKNSLRVSYK